MKFVDINYERYRNIFENSNKFSNQKNLNLHKCSEETPNEFGVYIAYEQYDLDDQYLVIWTGKNWVDFEHGGDICFGGKTREDHWSELPSFDAVFRNNRGSASIRTATNIVYQLQDSINYVVHNNPEIYYKLDRKEIISEKTERAFEAFRLLLNTDISNAKNSL